LYEKIILGKILHQSKSNHNLIITLTENAKIGDRVIGEEGKNIGRIFDIFGPVIAPYASIKLDDGVVLGKFESKQVFLGRKSSKKRQRSKRRKRPR
jgi:rRNA processing protein Gar1